MEEIIEIKKLIEIKNIFIYTLHIFIVTDIKGMSLVIQRNVLGKHYVEGSENRSHSFPGRQKSMLSEFKLGLLH